MCGVAEAMIITSVLGAVSSYAGAQQQASAEADAQRRMDQAAYDNYQFNLKQTARRRDEVKAEGAQKNMQATIERAQVEGKTRVASGESGLGQFGLAGGAVDDVFGDIAFQSAVGRSRVAQAVGNRINDLYAQDEASYLNYKAKNASFQPIMAPGIGNLMIDIASAGADYGQNPNRQFFKSTGPSGTMGSGTGQMGGTWQGNF